MRRPYRTVSPGNALIVSIILIALFMILTFGISTLILQSTTTIISSESAHRGFYAAESGVEYSLLSLKNHFPGYEEEKSSSLGNEPYAPFYHYTIRARSTRIPEIGDNTLLPDQSVTLALFKDVGYENSVDILDLSPDQHQFHLTYGDIIGGRNVCIKWTIFGFRNDTMATESMGNSYCSVAQSFPEAQVFSVLSSIDAIGTLRGISQVNTSLPVAEFLREHHQNYLVLSNITPDTAVEYHLDFLGDTFAQEQFIIVSGGKDRNFEQIEEVVVPQGDLFPAFHFAIFDPY